jgi:hypothetical protein
MTSAPWNPRGFTPFTPQKIVSGLASRLCVGAGRAVSNAAVARKLNRPAISEITHRRILQEPGWSGWIVIERRGIFWRDLSDDQIAEGERRRVGGCGQS